MCSDFSSQWQITRQKQLNRGRIYFSLSFRSVSPVRNERYNPFSVWGMLGAHQAGTDKQGVLDPWPLAGHPNLPVSALRSGKLQQSPVWLKLPSEEGPVSSPRIFLWQGFVSWINRMRVYHGLLLEWTMEGLELPEVAASGGKRAGISYSQWLWKPLSHTKMPPQPFSLLSVLWSFSVE